MTHYIKTFFAISIVLLSVPLFAMEARQLPVVKGARSEHPVISELNAAAASKDVERYKEAAKQVHEYYTNFRELTQVIGTKVRPNYLLDFALWLAGRWGHDEMKDQLIKQGADKELLKIQELSPTSANFNSENLKSLLASFIEHKEGEKSPRHNPVLTYYLNLAVMLGRADIIRFILHNYSSDVTVNSKAGLFGELDRSVLEYAYLQPEPIQAQILPLLTWYSSADIEWKNIHAIIGQTDTELKNRQPLIDALGMAANVDRSFEEYKKAAQAIYDHKDKRTLFRAVGQVSAPINDFALLLASSFYHPEMAKAALAVGANPTVGNNLALIQAVQKGSEDTAEALIAAGAPINTEDVAYAAALRLDQDHTSDMIDWLAEHHQKAILDNANVIARGWSKPETKRYFAHKVEELRNK